ncbi:hypothetical protein [Pseudomonas izuensis]|uniref:Uncharacterized protein n=1 Tax=Pseudomonas izuensis TaxID=2684212 RepID=A0ABM7RWF0_9PSED|nr:hypothetical protein [Pseudomonas izuensis]BCX70170.1 hypothetical protein LAB08_R48360 [Pseudomonas izuensis]
MNAWAFALIYEWLLSKNTANVFLLLIINDLGCFQKAIDLLAVAKSLQMQVKIKAEVDQSLAGR